MLERKHIGDTTPGWRWCLSPSCRAGQVHVKKVKEAPKQKRKRRGGVSQMPEPESIEEPDIFICHECGAKACVICDRPWHDGESCADYQARVKDRLDEEDKSIKEMQKVTKHCPGCFKKIQKNGGCPSMHCSQCSVNFCWNCASVFDAQGCKCYRRAA